MKASEFWKKIMQLKQFRPLILNCPSWLEFYHNGDRFRFEGQSVEIEEVVYTNCKDDPHVGAILIVDQYGTIDGKIPVVTSQRYQEVIETMRKIQHGEIEMGEVLTSGEEWKRNVFHYIFQKKS